MAETTYRITYPPVYLGRSFSADEMAELMDEHPGGYTVSVPDATWSLYADIEEENFSLHPEYYDARLIDLEEKYSVAGLQDRLRASMDEDTRGLSDTQLEHMVDGWYDEGTEEHDRIQSDVNYEINKAMREIALQLEDKGLKGTEVEDAYGGEEQGFEELPEEFYSEASEIFRDYNPKGVVEGTERGFGPYRIEKPEELSKRRHTLNSLSEVLAGGGNFWVENEELGNWRGGFEIYPPEGDDPGEMRLRTVAHNEDWYERLDRIATEHSDAGARERVRQSPERYQALPEEERWDSIEQWLQDGKDQYMALVDRRNAESNSELQRIAHELTGRGFPLDEESLELVEGLHHGPMHRLGIDNFSEKGFEHELKQALGDEGMFYEELQSLEKQEATGGTRGEGDQRRYMLIRPQGYEGEVFDVDALADTIMELSENEQNRGITVSGPETSWMANIGWGDYVGKGHQFGVRHVIHDDLFTDRLAAISQGASRSKVEEHIEHNKDAYLGEGDEARWDGILEWLDGARERYKDAYVSRDGIATGRMRAIADALIERGASPLDAGDYSRGVEPTDETPHLNALANKAFFLSAGYMQPGSWGVSWYDPIGSAPWLDFDSLQDEGVKEKLTGTLDEILQREASEGPGGERPIEDPLKELVLPPGRETRDTEVGLAKPPEETDQPLQFSMFGELIPQDEMTAEPGGETEILAEPATVSDAPQISDEERLRLRRELKEQVAAQDRPEERRFTIQGTPEDPTHRFTPEQLVDIMVASTSDPNVVRGSGYAEFVIGQPDKAWRSRVRMKHSPKTGKFSYDISPEPLDMMAERGLEGYRKLASPSYMLELMRSNPSSHLAIPSDELWSSLERQMAGAKQEYIEAAMGGDAYPLGIMMEIAEALNESPHVTSRRNIGRKMEERVDRLREFVTQGQVFAADELTWEDLDMELNRALGQSTGQGFRPPREFVEQPVVLSDHPMPEFRPIAPGLETTKMPESVTEERLDREEPVGGGFRQRRMSI